MFKHYFERIADQVAIYPLVSLSVFFLFFLALLIWVLRVDRNYITHMQGLPLADGSTPNEKEVC